MTKKKNWRTFYKHRLKNSDFGEEAANTLRDVVMETDEFQENTKNKKVVVKDNKGNRLSGKQLRKINAAKSFELSDKVKVDVGIITKGKQLHYNNGIQLNVGIEASLRQRSMTVP